MAIDCTKVPVGVYSSKNTAAAAELSAGTTEPSPTRYTTMFPCVNGTALAVGRVIPSRQRMIAKVDRRLTVILAKRTAHSSFVLRNGANAGNSEPAEVGSLRMVFLCSANLSSIVGELLSNTPFS